jgi:hypothetical protein
MQRLLQGNGPLKGAEDLCYLWGPCPGVIGSVLTEQSVGVLWGALREQEG